MNPSEFSAVGGAASSVGHSMQAPADLKKLADTVASLATLCAKLAQEVEDLKKGRGGRP